MLTLTSETFESAIADNPQILVNFTASWCGPCKMMAPLLTQLADDYVIGKLDIDDNMELAKKYGIGGVPTFISFKNGTEEKRAVGIRSKDALIQLIK